MSPDRKRRYSITQLNDYDRKVLGKYTKFYTNQIESNTAHTENLESERFKGSEIF